MLSGCDKSKAHQSFAGAHLLAPDQSSIQLAI